MGTNPEGANIPTALIKYFSNFYKKKDLNRLCQ